MANSSQFISSSDDGLPRGMPADAGVSSRSLLNFLDDVEEAGLELHDIMLWRDGKVVAEGWRWPYRADRLRMAHSMTKSVTACAIGILVDERRIALSDRVAQFFPEIKVEPDSPAARMTIEDLLTMRSGQGEEVSGSIWRSIPTSWIDEFFRIPFVHEPGTVYVYSSAASYMLSAIVTRVTGETIHDFLEPRLFKPLGIEGLEWDIGPDGINPGGNGISFTTADGLKLGILHASKGCWNGQQVLSRDWVELATRKHTGVPGDEYGYHWVVGDGWFAALGVFVQMVIVFPAAGAVLALNGAMKESSVLLPYIRRYFPAAFEGAIDQAADEELGRRLDAWKRPAGFHSSAVGDAAAFAGKWSVEPNDNGISLVEFDFGRGELTLILSDDEGAHSIIAACEGWSTTEAYLPGADLHHGYRMEGKPVAAGARWIGPQCLELVIHFLESAFRDTFTFSIEGKTLVIERRVNINSSKRAWPIMRATRRED